MSQKLKPSLGSDPDGYGIPIDTEKLIESRLLIAATSGQGKSWALRRILEQTHGYAQHIVIDPEGEFYTLREVFDYVLARAGHERERDCPAEVRSADLLARKLLELNVSTVIDIYDLKPDHRTEFVQRFIEALMEAPRSLWHPVLIVIDESHLFCPQSGESASGAAVADLMGRGRKRGFAGCLATQRFSRLHKDAAAMCKNVIIGGFTLDVDVKRAVDSLGFVGRDAETQIRQLQPGNFFVQGPAFSREVRAVKIAGVQTTHPKAGQKAPLPAVPRSTIKSVLDQLANLPAETERKLKTESELRQEVKRLEAEISRLTRELSKAGIDPELFERAKKEAVAAVNQVARQAVGVFDDKWDKLLLEARAGIKQTPQKPAASGVLEKAVGVSDDVQARLERNLRNYENRPGGIARPDEGGPWQYLTDGPGRIARSDDDGRAVPTKLPAGARRLLSVAVAWYGKGLTEGTWRAYANLKKSGSYKTYKSRLFSAGLVELRDLKVYATEAGLREVGDNIPDTPHSTAEVLAMWEPKLAPGARRMLRVILNASSSLSREEIAESSQMELSGSFKTYLSTLRTANLIVKVGNKFEPNREVLFL